MQNYFEKFFECLQQYEQRNAEFDQPKLFFRNGCDSPLTGFENDSNHLKLATKSTNNKVGTMLNLLLGYMAEECELEIFIANEIVERLEVDFSMEKSVPEFMAKIESKIFIFCFKKQITRTNFLFLKIMNHFKIKLDINCRNSKTQHYLIDKGQVSEEWFNMLQELHQIGSDDSEINFYFDCMLACIEHFVGEKNGHYKWVICLRDAYQKADKADDSIDYFCMSKSDVKNFDKGLELMTKWITIDNKGIWKANLSNHVIVEKEPVYHIHHTTN